MTSRDTIARRKLLLLELAADLPNVSRACKVTGYSRQQFYEIRRNVQTYGGDGLIDRLPAPNRAHRGANAPPRALLALERNPA